VASRRLENKLADLGPMVSRWSTAHLKPPDPLVPLSLQHSRHSVPYIKEPKSRGDDES